MKNKLEKHWHTLKILMINWTIFALIASAVAMILMQRNIADKNMQIKEMTGELEAIRERLMLIEDQYESGEIILHLKGKKGGDDGN